MADEKQSVRHVTRIYKSLLWLYPRGHRQEYGPLMVQLFRDQCREACRQGDRRCSKLWFRTFADLGRSAFLEQLTQLTSHMKNMPPGKLSFILFVVAVGAALLSCLVIAGQPLLALGLAYCSALALFLRAIVEWMRPPNELIRSLVWGGTIAVIFAIIIPIWGKFHLPLISTALPAELSRALVLIPMVLNAIVPMIKAGLRVARPRS